MKRTASTALFLLILLTPLLLRAQEFTDSTKGRRGKGALTALEKKYPQWQDSLASFLPQQVPEELQDDSTRARYLAAWRAYYDYRVSGFAHRKKVFAWQHLSTQITFFVVLALVFVGIVFSGIQFYKGMKEKPQKGEGKPEAPVTEIEASATGIKVSSPVLGVIILVISLAFFYLYLVYIYPIHEVF